MSAFFESWENRIYTLLSVIAALNTSFFIAVQVPALKVLRFSIPNDIFYLGFAVCVTLSCGALWYFTRTPKLTDWKRYLATLLLIWLPAIVILGYGLSESKNFHYIFMLAAGVYYLLAGILISGYIIERDRVSTQVATSEARGVLTWFRAQGLPTLLLIIFITGLFFVFGLSRLTQYAAVDEPLWFDGRIAKYWKNVEERDWKGTNISDKPGITVALASGPGLWFKKTSDYKTSTSNGDILGFDNSVESFYFAYRFPLLLAVTALLPLFYFFLERLLGRRNAVFAFVFIGTSPVLIGMTKIINPDSLLWVFTPLSLISYLVFLKRGAFRYLFFSGIFLGLALLTKYVANILFVFYLGLIFLEYLYNPAHHETPFAEYLKRSLRHLLILTFSALATFYAFFPAVWIKPEKLFTSTLFSQAFEKVAPLFLVVIGFILLDQWINRSRITTAIIGALQKVRPALTFLIMFLFLGSIVLTLVNTWTGMSAYDFMDLLASPKTIATRSDFVGIFLTNVYPFVFGVTPLVLLGLLIVPFFFHRNFTQSVALRSAFYFIILILLYYLGSTVNNVAAIVRYQIILFPIAAIVAGIAVEHLLVLLHKKFTKTTLPTPIIAASLIAVLGIGTLVFTPFPLSYASTFLPAKYHTDVKDMGAGSYEAARYLNSLPNAEQLYIWTDKSGVCKFFVGRCTRTRNYEKLRAEGIDYIVVSAGRKSRTTKMMAGDIAINKPGLIRFDLYYDQPDADWKIEINKRPSQYVKVFKFE